MTPTNDITYNIQIHYTTKTVQVACIGMNCVDADLKGYYMSVDDLPLWVQDRLSVLMMLDVPPPLNDVDGVGSRLGPYTYWVYK